MTNPRFHALFGGAPRGEDAPLTQRDMDLAASIQAVTDEVVLRLTRAIAAETGAKQLCLAGGVALNCVANGKVLRDGKFERIWVQPAAGDAGGALGAALAAYHLYYEPAAPAAQHARCDARQLSRARVSHRPRSSGALRRAGAVFEVERRGELIDRDRRGV